MRLSPISVCTILAILAFPLAPQAGNGPGRCKKDGNEIEWSGATDLDLLRDFAERCIRLNHVQVLGSEIWVGKFSAVFLNFFLCYLFFILGCLYLFSEYDNGGTLCSHDR